MKRTFLIAAFTIYSLTVFAQRGNFQNMSAQERAQFQTNRMVAALEIDSALVDQVHDINLKYATQWEKERTPEASRYEMMAKMEKMNHARNKDFKKVLTKEQYRKFMRQQQEMRNRMQERMRSGGQEGRGSRYQ
jgi:hypothetical protein